MNLFPITHCSVKQENNLGVEKVDFTELSFFNFIRIVSSNEPRLIVQRICSKNENPTDLFYYYVGPFGYFLLLVSFLASIALQLLGNYYTMYQCSKVICCHRPIFTSILLADLGQLLQWSSDEKLHQIAIESFKRNDKATLNLILKSNTFHLLKTKTIKSLKEQGKNDFIEHLNKVDKRALETNSRVWQEEPMDKALREDNVRQLCFLSALGGHWYTPLLLSVVDSVSMKGLKFLMKMNFNVNVREIESGGTPLHYLVSSKNLDHSTEIEDCLKILIKNGADVNSKDFNGLTPLDHIAESSGSSVLAQILIDHKADVNVKHNGCMTPLHKATIYGKIDCMKILIDNVSDIDAKDDDNQTPLHKAAYYVNIDGMKLLIDNNAKVNAKDMFGKTPLHIASIYVKLDCVKLLIDNKADINAKNNVDQTPLHIATIDGKLIV